MSRFEFSGLADKKIAILGLGIENFALVKFLLKEKIMCPITIIDARSREELEEKYSSLSPYKITWRLGADNNGDLDGFDILFRSPGWPLFDPEIVKAKNLNVRISSAMQLFFELSPSNNIIGVTGTKGKGTTASLVHHILKTARRRVWLGGNIGIAPFEFIGRIRKNDWVVLELSSFQLEDMALSPRHAVITNFTPEHLAPADPHNPNFHRTEREYWLAKLNIIKWQKKGDTAILNKKIKSRIKNLKSKSKILFFAKSELESKLIGEHNKENIAAAVLAARRIGVKEPVIVKAVKTFRGLPHRLDLVAHKRGVVYFNDSFSTIPESTIIALRAFNRPIILIAGGAEKNSLFKELANEIKRRVKLVILLTGKATPRLKEMLIIKKYPKSKIKSADSMLSAVRQARQNAVKGDVVLLSPACASFGMFKNYKERGLKFKAAAVNK